MAYCTRADLVTRYGEQELIDLTDRAGLGVTDDDVIAAAIARAEADIDGALADAGYTPPVSWSRLTQLGESLARYYLGTAGTRPPEVQADYTAAQGMLTRISTGAIRPPGVEPGDQPAAGDVDFSDAGATWPAADLDDY